MPASPSRVAAVYVAAKPTRREMEDAMLARFDGFKQNRGVYFPAYVGKAIGITGDDLHKLWHLRGLSDDQVTTAYETMMARGRR